MILAIPVTGNNDQSSPNILKYRGLSYSTTKRWHQYCSNSGCYCDRSKRPTLVIETVFQEKIDNYDTETGEVSGDLMNSESEDLVHLKPERKIVELRSNYTQCFIRNFAGKS
jgi:hypothetical protein